LISLLKSGAKIRYYFDVDKFYFTAGDKKSFDSIAVNHAATF